MHCENFLCIYEKNGKCLIEGIDLDIMGQCTSCIYPNFEKEVLQRYKEKTIKDLDK